MIEHELWADAYLFINIFYFMLLIVPDAGEGNDFQMRRFFLSLEHSCTWNANFNQLLDGEICNKSAISAGFPFIPVSAVGLCPLEEIWIVCKIIQALCNNLVAETIYLSCVLIYLIYQSSDKY